MNTSTTAALNLLNVEATFTLDSDFVRSYATRTHEPFDGNPLGYFVYKRTYSRPLVIGGSEEWYQTVQRVVEGTFRMQERHIRMNGLGWKPEKAQRHARRMYDLIFEMKFLPPGRGLWAMGSPITEERGLFAALNNCAFVSTETIAEDLAKPFEFLMDMSMLGVGVGFDVKGAGKVRLQEPRTTIGELPEVQEGKVRYTHAGAVYVVPDTREGWVEALRVLLESYMVPQRVALTFDYSEVRGKGEPIAGFGGVSSGPGPLQDMLETIREICFGYSGRNIDVEFIADVMNLIGRAVVAGNVRRTAEIMFGDPTDEAYLDLKNPTVNPERNDFQTGWGWTSNNSVFAEVGMDYGPVARRTAINGEPGYAWLENMQDFGRMCEPRNFRDWRAKGGNPCLEQTLESYELCCLVEVLPTNCDDYEEYTEALKYAYMYAKTVTLGMTHWPETNRVMMRNRRIGTSLTGLAQFADVNGMATLQRWLTGGYEYVCACDAKYSDWFAVPQSIKKTSVKPSGTVSKVAGVWAGVHRPESRYIIQRIRLAANSPYVPRLKEAGIHVEPSVNDPEFTVVASFPVDNGEGRSSRESTIWEQVAFAVFIQRWWADNQVSCTVTFDPDTEADEIERTLDMYQFDLKGISFLPRFEGGAFPQMPWEGISKETYEEMLDAQTGTLDLSDGRHEVNEAGCDGAACEISFA